MEILRFLTSYWEKVVYKNINKDQYNYFNLWSITISLFLFISYHDYFSSRNIKFTILAILKCKCSGF